MNSRIWKLKPGEKMQRRPARLSAGIPGALPVQRVTAASSRLDPTLSEKDVAAGFRRISSADSRRDLSPLLQDKMIELAWYLYDKNPLAKRLINLTTVFVTGDGLRVKADDPDVQERLEAFWDDPVNRMDLELPRYVTELAVFGEQLYLTSENAIDGSLRLWYIDPSEIDQVIYGGAGANIPGADRSIALPIEILLKQRMGEANAPKLYPFRPDEDPNSPTFGMAAGNCFYFGINKAKRGSRGRSDIFAQADWLDAYEQLLFSGVDRADLQNRVFLDVLMRGGTPQDMTKWLQENSIPPRRGSQRIHNENMEFKYTGPELKAAEMKEFFRTFKNHILGTAGFPEHWFAEGGETNLATAGEMGAPTLKTLQERQKFVKYMLASICNVAIDRAIVHGALDANVDRTVEIEAPPLETRDMAKIATAVQQLANGLSLAVQESFLQRETAAKLLINLVSQLGQQIDTEAELKALEAGLRPNEADYAATPKAPAAKGEGQMTKDGMVQ